MKPKRTKLAAAIAYITGISALTGAAIPGRASDVLVEVTGSHIKSVVNEGALPLQTITREEIAKSGAQTAFDILERVSAFMGYGSFPESFSLRNFMAQGFRRIF